MYDFEGEYKKQLEVAREQQARNLEQIEKIQDELTALQTRNNPKDENRIYNLKMDLFNRKYLAYTLGLQMEFLRPDTQDDVDYRLDMYADFAEAIKRDVPDDLPFRFHGTKIYFAREILRSGEISCSQDRYGYATSHDLSGHISVVTKDKMAITVHGYIDLLDYCMPAGCIFVLLPSEEDAVMMNDQMKKVNFKNNPSVLYAILATPENVPRVKMWCVESGIDTNKVCTFFDFLRWDFGTKREENLTFSEISI